MLLLYLHYMYAFKHYKISDVIHTLHIHCITYRWLPSIPS